jgi:hypothetical protein
MSDGSRVRLLLHLASRYQAGASLDELAPLFGCSARTLAARLREIGVTIRSPGRRGHDDSPDWRAHAEQMRNWAGRTNDPETRRIMLRIAAGYDKLADNIKESGSRQPDPPSDE